MKKEDLNPQKNIQWLNEWEEFSKGSFSSASAAPELLRQVHQDLHPPRFQVWSKLLAIHGITGFISLLFCPQMGVGGWMTDLMNVFMKLGHSICFILCGAFFMGGGFLLAQLFLEKEELKRLRQDRVLLLPGLTIFSFGILKMLGAGNHHSASGVLGGVTLDAFLWMLGAICVGWLFFKPKNVLPSSL